VSFDPLPREFRESLEDHLAQYNAAVERMNAIAANGPLDSIPIVRAYRHELKAVLRSCRHLIAAELDPDTRYLREQQLRILKRLHWDCLNLERCSIEIATREN
jgi:hypothetical protein